MVNNMCEDVKNYYDQLFEVISNLSSKEEVKSFFLDLCSTKELDAMAQRVKAAKLLINGETYEKIIAKTNISSTTLSRISRCVKNGEGYKNHL